MARRDKAERFGVGSSTRMNQAELTEREKRELWAAKQVAAAKRSWRIAGYVIAALVLLLAGFAWNQAGYFEGWRACRDSQCGRASTP